MTLLQYLLFLLNKNLLDVCIKNGDLYKKKYHYIFPENI